MCLLETFVLFSIECLKHVNTIMFSYTYLLAWKFTKRKYSFIMVYVTIFSYLKDQH